MQHEKLTPSRCKPILSLFLNQLNHYLCKLYRFTWNTLGGLHRILQTSTNSSLGSSLLMPADSFLLVQRALKAKKNGRHLDFDWVDVVWPGREELQNRKSFKGEKRRNLGHFFGGFFFTRKPCWNAKRKPCLKFLSGSPSGCVGSIYP